jgi:hypothetical protein
MYKPVYRLYDSHEDNTFEHAIFKVG